MGLEAVLTLLKSLLWHVIDVKHRKIDIATLIKIYEASWHDDVFKIT